jgi:hypothetical protein
MSLKKVVIATKKAVEGTLLKPWIHYIPAEKLGDFINQILEIFNGKLNYEQIANNGFYYVKKYHSLSNVVSTFLRVMMHEIQ